MEQASVGTDYGRIFSFLRAHPVLLLLLLSPGIPEYISSSSPVFALLTSPPLFFFQLLLNLGLYGPGVLLVREALVRWKKGWASSLLLGGAYGILEEGIAVSTMSNPHASADTLGYYGRWLGINWVWSPGIAIFHAVISISLPILLLGLAAPQLKDKPFLSRRSIALAFLILFVDVFVLMDFVLRAENFWMGWGVFFGECVAIVVLVSAGRFVSTQALQVRSALPRLGAKGMFLLGVAFLPIIFLVDAIGPNRLPAPFPLLAMLFLEGLLLWGVLSSIGRARNERLLIAFSSGLVAPIIFIGLLAEIFLPLVVVVDILMILFLRRLWKEYTPVKVLPMNSAV